MATIDVASFAVLDETTGEVDIDSTMDAVLVAVGKYATEHKADREVIETAMLSLWAENPRLSLNVPALITLTANRVGFEPSGYASLTKRIASVLHDSDRIQVVKGPNGGCKLRTEEQLSYYRANGKDMVSTPTGSDKIAKLEAKLAAAKAAQK